MGGPTRALFQLARGLVPPLRWIASSLEQNLLDIHLDFEPGATFAFPECGAGNCPVHDSTDQQWRHLNLAQDEACLHARAPRVRCGDHRVRQVVLPWARSERLCAAVRGNRHAPDASDARVQAGTSGSVAGEPSRGGFDQPPPRSGLRKPVRGSRPGLGDLRHPSREQKVLAEFKIDLKAHRDRAEAVSDFSADLWRPYRDGITEKLPNARLAKPDPGGQARARGYRTHRHYIAIIFITAGKLSIGLPTCSRPPTVEASPAHAVFLSGSSAGRSTQVNRARDRRRSLLPPRSRKQPQPLSVNEAIIGHGGSLFWTHSTQRRSRQLYVWEAPSCPNIL